MRYIRLISLLMIMLCLLPCVACAADAGDDTGYDICFEDFMESADPSGKPMIL